MELLSVLVEGKKIEIINPQKVMWDVPVITKIEYIQYLLTVSAHLLAYTGDRLLTMIRFPDGIKGKSFYQKEIPDYAPAWLSRVKSGDKEWILLNDAAALVWVANQAALELHVSFNKYEIGAEDFPSELVFDLDPMEEDNFSLVQEVALITKEVLDSFGLLSVPKTSGATGMQIYVPIEPKYTYAQTRLVNEFIARYIAEKYPYQVTLERSVKKRGKLLYFDYLQLWRGRTLPVPYSVRARAGAPVSAPLTWEEVAKGVLPANFTVKTMGERIKQQGDLFSPVTSPKYKQSLADILDQLSFVRISHD